MSALPQQLPAAAPPMRVTINGRIDSTRSHEGVRYTVVTCPAPDQYSHPSTVEVRSKGQLGGNGEEVTLRCQVSGFARRFQYPNKNTGQITRGVRYEHSLTAIE